MFGTCAVDSNERFYSLATCGRPLNDMLNTSSGKNPTSIALHTLDRQLLSNESLPILLDKLVPSWAVILLIPRSIYTRYGLTVRSTVAPLVQLFLWLFFPTANLISKVLDWMLGKGHVALLRRAELKMFVDFHGNEARKGGDLTPDETTIIVQALELTKKTAKDAMTPISKAFSLDLDRTLNLWIDIGYVRMRYGALLWDHEKRKLDAGHNCLSLASGARVIGHLPNYYRIMKCQLLPMGNNLKCMAESEYDKSQLKLRNITHYWSGSERVVYFRDRLQVIQHSLSTEYPYSMTLKENDGMTIIEK
ncbi:DUF21 domain-containing protein [Capsicum chinense]|nr:DUF21 domain-containing protein [Capsicum chinense]